MIYLQNLFLLGFAVFYFIYDGMAAYYAVFLNIAEGNMEDESTTTKEAGELVENITSWSLPSHFSEDVETNFKEHSIAVDVENQKYQISELTTENDCFVHSILTELGLDTTDIHEEAEEVTGDMILTMNDWHEEKPNFNADLEFTAAVTARIAQNIKGIQTWVCSIIGYENEYIHVLDGESRAWINIIEFDYLSLSLHDVIEIEVDRNDNGLQAKKITILKSNADSYQNYICEVENLPIIDDYTFEETEFYVKSAEV